MRSMLEAIDGDTDVIAGVRAVVTGGHTRDHQAALVSDGGECFMHLADIVPTRSHMRGPWNQAYDLDALRTMEQKAHYLGARRGEPMVAVVRARRHRVRRDGETTIAGASCSATRCRSPSGYFSKARISILHVCS